MQDFFKVAKNLPKRLFSSRKEVKPDLSINSNTECEDSESDSDSLYIIEDGTSRSCQRASTMAPRKLTAEVRVELIIHLLKFGSRWFDKLILDKFESPFSYISIPKNRSIRTLSFHWRGISRSHRAAIFSHARRRKRNRQYHVLARWDKRSERGV